MFEKVYLEEYIFSYERICEILEKLCVKHTGKITKECIGKTNFNYDINSYKIGKGKKQVLLIGTTHSNEIVTTYFILEYITNLLEEYETILNKTSLFYTYTFIFIPILNVDGYIITSSNIVKNFSTFSKNEIENLSKFYLDVYNRDDEIASMCIKKEKEFYNVLKASISNIKDIKIARSVKNILKNTNLDERVLNIWSANGLGIDQNSNSIHRFCQIKKLREKEKFASLRYNDIPVTCESPMSYPGNYTFDRSPENYCLYKYIMKLYKCGNLTHIFSFHSTGGLLYSMPDKCYVTQKTMDNYIKLFNIYSNITGYKLMEDENKYGVMDFYRIALKDTYTFTIELSKLNANPIGPFADISNLKKEIIDNKNAVIKVIRNI